MKLFGLSGLLNLSVSAILCVFLFLNIRKKLLVRLWAFYALGVSIWGLSSYMVSTVPEGNLASAYFWWKAAHVGLLFLPALYYHFVCAFLKINRRAVIIASYALSTLCFIANLSSATLYLGTLHFRFNEFYWPTSPGIFLLIHMFFLVFGLIALSNYELIKGYFRIRNRKKQLHLLFFTIGGMVGWLGGWVSYLENFDLGIYPMGCFLIALYPLLYGYAIFRHQLFDIKVILRKTLLYSLTIMAITVIYFIIVYLIEKVFSLFVGYHSIPIALAIIAFFSIIFNPLKNKIQTLIDKYFFHGTIDEIDEENTRMREELQKSEKLKAVATLAAGMAHEIKNPLTSIKTFSEHIESKGSDPEFRHKFHTLINSEVGRINNIVKQLLEFSKPKDLQTKPTDINQLLDDTLSLLNNKFVQQNIKVTKNYTQLPEIEVDPNQIKQVFLNLFLNAIEAMPKGGTLTIKTAAPTNSIPDTQYSILITDTGQGIAPTNLKHIFDPFYTKKTEGTGLGLSIVHGIIEKHNGIIEVNSKLGEGTTFTISLKNKEILNLRSG